MLPHIQTLIDALEAKPAGTNQWQGRCTIHNDGSPSVSIGIGKADRALVHCHAGCSTASILNSVGLTLSALFPDGQKTKQKIVATYRYVSEDGEHLYDVVRYQPKSFRQRRADGQWNMDGVPRVLYRLPELIASTGIVYIVGGEKDVDNMRAEGHVATTNPGGEGKWGKLSNDKYFADRDVIIIADRDPTGRAHAQDVAQRITAKTIVVRELPEKDFSAWRARYPDADLAESLQSDHLPNICITNRQMRDITSESIAALVKRNDPPEIFTRMGEITRKTLDEDDRVSIKAATESFLRGMMERAADYYSVNKDGIEKIVPPPIDIVKDAIAMDLQKFPPLQSIVETPIVRKDGTILTAPGYDRSTRLYYSPAPGFGTVVVPDEPTREDCDRAIAKLYEVFHDFPFVDDCSRANAIAAVLTSPMRPVISGSIPLALFDKPQPGTGGSLLAEAIALVATGRDVAMASAPREEEEWQKAITTHLFHGHPIVIFDNVEHTLESDALALALTCSVWQGRMLGHTKEVRVPARTIWMATGNNVNVGRQLVRRVYQVRIDAQTSRPERRSGFLHPDLKNWIKSDRAQIISAALTLCRAWTVAGSPAPSTPIVGSFEEWCQTVGGILEFAGVEGFLGNLEETRDTAGDEEFNEWEGFLMAILAAWGTNAFPTAKIEEEIPKNKLLREALPTEFSRCIHHSAASGLYGTERWEVDSFFKLRMGKALKKRAGSRFGAGVYLSRVGLDQHSKVALWQVIKSAGVEIPVNALEVPF